MARRKRPTYRIIVTNNELPSCWYCEKKCRGALTFPNGDEIWACQKCAKEHGRIKRFKKLGDIVTSKPQSLEKQQVLCVGKTLNSTLEEK